MRKLLETEVRKAECDANTWMDGIKAMPSLQKGARWVDEDEDEEISPTGTYMMEHLHKEEYNIAEDVDNPI